MLQAAQGAVRLEGDVITANGSIISGHGGLRRGATSASETSLASDNSVCSCNCCCCLPMSSRNTRQQRRNSTTSPEDSCCSSPDESSPRISSSHLSTPRFRVRNNRSHSSHYVTHHLLLRPSKAPHEILYLREPLTSIYYPPSDEYPSRDTIEDERHLHMSMATDASAAPLLQPPITPDSFKTSPSPSNYSHRASI